MHHSQDVAGADAPEPPAADGVKSMRKKVVEGV
jgi:hypothetical protein